MTTDEYRDAPVQVWMRGRPVAAFTRAEVYDTDPDTGVAEVELTRGWSADGAFILWANRMPPSPDADGDDPSLTDLVVDVADQPGALYARHELRGCFASEIDAIEEDDGVSVLITSMTIQVTAPGG